jgi:Transposase DDE domain group 1
MLTFIAETREYIWGELRNGDRPTGQQIADHLRHVCAALPASVQQIYGRADSGFYCWEAVAAYEEFKARLVISARKTSRLVEQLRQAEWKPSQKTDAGWECEFRYRPEGWKKEYRFVALRYEKAPEEREAEESEQYQLFETSQYKYRVFVTNMTDPIYFVVWFYNQRGGAENLIKEANNDAGLAAHPSGRFDVNGNHFQLAMLAYNLNCWLMLFNREPQADATALRHTTLATARLRFLFVAAKICRHAGRTGVSYSDHYEEKGVFQRLMDRLRRIAQRGQGYAPVMQPALC